MVILHQKNVSDL